MKNFLLNMLNKDEKLLKHSALIFFATIVGMVINYFFHVLVGRMLGPADYGIFGSIMSILYIISVFSGTINISITKFSSKFKAKKEYGKIKALLVDYSLKLLLIGTIIFIIFFLSSGLISSVLGIPTVVPIIILGLIIPFSFVRSVIRGVMRGMQMFKEYSTVSIIEPIARFIIGIGLIALGFSVTGAVSGVVFSGLIACFVSLIFFGFLFKERAVKVSKAEVIKYSLPIFTITLFITIMTNIDVILVKYFFPSESAGFYVAASTLTKVIFFLTGALITVMFPKISEMNERRINTKNMLINSLFYVFAFSALAIVLLWIAPNLITTMVFGEAFLETSTIILPFAIAMMFASFCLVIINYDLALKKTNITYPVVLVTLLEVFLILVFHTSLIGIVKILIGANVLLFFILIVLNKNELIGNANISYNAGL